MLNDFCQISSHTQLLVERMLTAKVLREGESEGEKFMDVYLQANCKTIQLRWDKLMARLDELEVM